MSVWLAHRCEASLALVHHGLSRCSVLGARRGQGLLVALEERGLPVRRSACLLG
ncbi:Uncharacterised protein [Mycobacteroides abscessus subsp. abscessus]|nr:Uncharacterised protein [Mycobacteroides abscessus subsp. abscessus]